jgi:hypothetical protein
MPLSGQTGEIIGAGCDNDEIFVEEALAALKIDEHLALKLDRQKGIVDNFAALHA